jgi:hypothetical protein
MNELPANRVCTCSHVKRLHFCTKVQPAGPCGECDCRSFNPERMCRCGHGEKAHARGPCHHAYVCGCHNFRFVQEVR